MTAQERILEIVRRSLAGGQTVEIDGIGVFRLAAGGGYEFVPETRPRVFLAYVAEDLGLVRRLRDGLAAAGCAPWLDKDQLLAGQNWPRAIERAIAMADVFVACFSPRSIVKRGQFQSELRYALNCAARLPMEEVFVVPVRLEPCQVPQQISGQWQYIDLFPGWERGMARLTEAIHRASRGRTPVVLTS